MGLSFTLICIEVVLICYSDRATVICVDLNEDAGNATTKALNASYARSTPAAHFIRGDVTDWQSMCSLFREADGLLSKLHSDARIDFVFA